MPDLPRAVLGKLAEQITPYERVGLLVLAGAGALSVLMLAWLIVSGARGGGIVLGLILLVVLAGPLGLAGLIMLRRQPAEVRALAADAAVAAAEKLIQSRLDDKRAADLIKRSIEEIPSKLN